MRERLYVRERERETLCEREVKARQLWYCIGVMI